VTPTLWFVAGFFSCLAAIVVGLLVLVICMGPADGYGGYWSEL
jgi:hypothetical protein